MSIPNSKSTIQVDIVSDVVCPWCLVGFRQLADALKRTGLKAALRWHPFELNPEMPSEGENLRDHLMGKYGINTQQSVEARQRLTDIGVGLGFAFNFTDDMRMVNTFQAHQLLDWADGKELQSHLKQALFTAYFSDGRDVSDPKVLVKIAASVGLDADEASKVLDNGSHADEVRKKQQFWTQRGISGVPAMIFDSKYLVTGAQGVDSYADVLKRVSSGRISGASEG